MNGEQIRELRAELGMNQDEFAQVIGTTVATVSRWELDKHSPRREQEKALATLAEYIRNSETDKENLRRKLLVNQAAGVPVASYLALGVGVATGLLAGKFAIDLIKGLFADED